MRTAPHGPPRIDSDDMLVEQVEQALRMMPEERVWTGIELFEAWCVIARAGANGYAPDADEAVTRQKLEQRLEIARMVDGRVPA